MTNFLANKLYLFLIVFIAFSTLIGGAFALTPVITKMNLLTYIASLKTKTITVTQLQQIRAKQPQAVILIDVRTPEEYTQDHIADSILVPLSDIESRFGIKQIEAIANRTIQSSSTQSIIVLYCTSGMRSFKAYKLLKESGLNTVALAGGITAWRETIPAKQDNTPSELNQSLKSYLKVPSSSTLSNE